MEGDVACLSEEEAGTGIGNLMKINQAENNKKFDFVKEVVSMQFSHSYLSALCLNVRLLLFYRFLE